VECVLPQIESLSLPHIIRLDSGGLSGQPNPLLNHSKQLDCSPVESGGVQSSWPVHWTHQHLPHRRHRDDHHPAIVTHLSCHHTTTDPSCNTHPTSQTRRYDGTQRVKRMEGAGGRTRYARKFSFFFFLLTTPPPYPPASRHLHPSTSTPPPAPPH